MKELTDLQFRTLSIAIRSSDREAFAELFNGLHDSLFRYADYIVRDKSAAEDLIQETFVKLWQVRETLDPDRSLKALLFQIVRNLSLNHERHKKRHRTEDLDGHLQVGADEHPIEDILDAEKLEIEMQAWIDGMPERRKEAFLLSRREGLSHDEIARLMGLAPKTVNNHIVLALQHIRAKLDEYRASGVSDRSS